MTIVQAPSSAVGRLSEQYFITKRQSTNQTADTARDTAVHKRDTKHNYYHLYFIVSYRLSLTPAMPVCPSSIAKLQIPINQGTSDAASACR